MQINIYNYHFFRHTVYMFRGQTLPYLLLQITPAMVKLS